MKRQFFTENKVVISHPFKSRIPPNSQLFDTNWLKILFNSVVPYAKLHVVKSRHKYGKWNCKKCLFPVKRKYLFEVEFNLIVLISDLIFQMWIFLSGNSLRFRFWLASEWFEKGNCRYCVRQEFISGLWIFKNWFEWMCLETNYINCLFLTYWNSVQSHSGKIRKSLLQKTQF